MDPRYRHHHQTLVRQTKRRFGQLQPAQARASQPCAAYLLGRQSAPGVGRGRLTRQRAQRSQGPPWPDRCTAKAHNRWPGRWLWPGRHLCWVTCASVWQASGQPCWCMLIATPALDWQRGWFRTDVVSRHRAWPGKKFGGQGQDPAPTKHP